MLELLPISFTFKSLAKVLLIIGVNMFVGTVWHSPIGFQKQWAQAMQWKEGDENNPNRAYLMSTVGALLNSFLLNILLIAFDIPKQHYLSAILASTILSGFHAIVSWNNLFYSKKSEYKRCVTLYFIHIGFTFVLYSLISLVLISF